MASGSTATFHSNYDLFYLGVQAKATVGSWAGTILSTLTTWNTTTGQDGNSVSGDPKFIDINGADNVLGGVGTPLGDGRDDNFGLQKGSPAIDAGDSYPASLTDIEGNPRHDDPSTPNTGTGWPLYVEQNTSSNGFSATGTAKGWESSGTYWNLTLPFAFTFYGTSYTSVEVSSNGYLQFAGPDYPSNTVSQAEFLRNAIIAPLWGNVSTYPYPLAGNNIFVDTSVTGQVKIRWQGEVQNTSNPVNFSVTLFSDGTFRFDYGTGNTGLTPIVGVSSGNGYSFVLSSYNGLGTLTSANSLTWSAKPGLNYDDIGAYEFQGDSSDTTPPTVTDVSNIPANNGTTDLAFSSMHVDFSESLDAISAKSPANYSLVEADANGNFDTAGAITIPLLPAYSFPETGLTLDIPSGILSNGKYRLTLSGTKAIYDTSGNPLNGGVDYVRYFTIDRSHDALPVANAQSATVNEDQSTVLTLTGTDADGFALTYAIVQNPAHGALSAINPVNDTVTYTPDLYYSGPDSFTFSVDNGRAGVDDATVSLTVLPVNQRPTTGNQSVTFSEDQSEVITLAGSDVETARGNLAFTLVAAPGHGTLTQGTYGLWTYTPNQYYHGTDSFTYTVTDRGDPDGTVSNALTSTPGTVSLTILKVNHPPQAENESYTATENTHLTVSAPGVLADDVDVDGDPLTALLISGPAHGSLTLAPNGSFVYTPAANYLGPDSFVYVANDGQVDSNNATVSITVQKPAPVAVNDAYALLENKSLVVAASSGVLANDTDILNDALTTQLVSGPSHGTLVLNADGSFTYTPSLNYSGSDSFTYQALDGTVYSNTATAALSVTWVNQPPVGTNNTLTIMQNTPYTFQASDFGFTDPADAPPDNFLAVKISALPAAGALWDGAQKVNAGDIISVGDINKGLFTFVPDTNTYGQDYAAFAFQVQDDGGTANGGINLDQTPRTFTINVAVAPVVVSQSYSTSNDTPLTIAAPGILGDATDLNGAALAASLVSGPAYGTLVFNPDGSFTYTPQPRWAGNDAFTYRAYDGIAYSNTATISLAIVSDDRPAVATNHAYTTGEDTPLTVAGPGVLAGATDIDGNPLTASLLTGPAHGALTLNNDGSFTYTPAAGYSGADSFTYAAFDGTLNSNAATVALAVSPVNPSLDAIADKTAQEGQVLSFTAVGHDADQSRTLTYSLGSGAPAGASIDPQTGLFSWTPAEGQGMNAYAITVIASDDGTPVLSASQTFHTTVLEDSNISARGEANSGSPDTFQLLKTGATDQVLLNGTTVYVGSATAPLTFTGSSNNDTLVLDFSGGNPIPVAGITFNGGTGVNTIELVNGTASNVSDAFIDAHDGSITVDGATVTYTDLQPITDNLNAATRSFTFGNSANIVTMAIGASQTTLSSAGTSESVTFANPTASLSLTTGSGDDQITISGAKPSFGVTVDPGAGANFIEDQTGSAVARFDGTNGTGAIRLMQTTTYAVMAYVNNSMTICVGVNGFDAESQGGSDRITLQGTLPSVLVNGGSGSDTVDASGFRGSLTTLNVGKLTAPSSASITSGTGTSSQTAATQVTQGGKTTNISGNALTQDDVLGVTSAWLSDFLKGPKNNPNTAIEVVI